MWTTVMALLNIKSIGAGFAKAGAWAIEHWKELTVAAMLATIIYQNVFETRYAFGIDTIPYLEAQLKEKDEHIENLMSSVEAITTANETLTAAIETTNGEIEQWRQVSVDLEKKNAALSGELRGVRRSTQSRVDDILKQPAPADCRAAIDYLRESVPSIKFGPRGGIILP